MTNQNLSYCKENRYEVPCVCCFIIVDASYSKKISFLPDAKKVVDYKIIKLSHFTTILSFI